MFKLYACKLRLNGNVLNEIRKTDVTAAEIEVLRALHGSDSVLDIEETGRVNRSDRDERQRLTQEYASFSIGEALERKRRMLTELFGHARNPLPKDMDDVSAEDDGRGGAEADRDIPVAPTRRTRVAKSDIPAFAE